MRGIGPHLSANALAALVEEGLGAGGDEARHLARCRSCFAAYAEAVRVRSGRLPALDPVSLPPDLVAIAEAIAVKKGAEQRPRRARSRRAPLRVLVPAGLVAALLLLGILFAPSIRRPAVDRRSIGPVREALVAASAAGMILPGAGESAGENRPVYRSGTSGGEDRLEAALATIATAYGKDQENRDLAYWLIAGYVAADQVSTARVFLREGLDHFPGDRRLLEIEAIIAYRTNDLGRAEELLRRALRRGNRSASALFNLGFLLGETNRAEEARPYLEEAMRLDGSLVELRATEILNGLGR